jgi:glycosyltransferase involved in cell wall biosynthesis
MKILVINFAYANQVFNSNGTLKILERNMNILKRNFSEANIITYTIFYYKSKFESFFYFLRGFCGGLTPKDIKEIRLLLVHQQVDCVFLNTSRVGLLCKYIKTVPIITFFHNIETVFLHSSIKYFGPLKKIFYFIVKIRGVSVSEKYALRYSKKLITLNRRDSDGLEKIYGRKADLIFPTTFDDVYNADLAMKYDVAGTENTLLFVGVDFFGNTDGLFWFIEKCLDKINAPLWVVGNSMNKYANKYPGKRVTFFGYVDDIALYYYKASAVVLPIISGGGMKTKTCEALMYGKTIFGTSEAFEGYEALKCAENGLLCNTQEEFVTNINRFLAAKKSNINNYSREVFVNNFSTGLWEKRIRDFFTAI